MNSQSTVRLVIAGLAGTLVLCVAGIIALAVLERAVPDVLSNVTVGTLGALAAMLARTGDTDVRVVNDPDEPVPVEADDRPLRADRGHTDMAVVVCVVLLTIVLVILVL